MTERGRRLTKTALHQAVLDTRLHQVRLLVCRHAVDVDSRDLFGRTPLMLACLLGDEHDAYRISRVLLSAGTFVNTRDNLRRTALHYASLRGRERLVGRLLRDDGTDLGAADVDGNTPLMHAAMAGHPGVVRLLIAATLRCGSAVDERNARGYTALLLACKYAHYASAHALLTLGAADPRVRDNEFFFTAPQWLARCGELRASFRRQRPQHASAEWHPGPRYEREHRMYDGAHDRPACTHAHAPAHPLGESLDTALRLPAIFSRLAVDEPAECCLSGAPHEDARAALVHAIGVVTRRARPAVSRASYRRHGSRSQHHPSTARLNAQTGNTPAGGGGGGGGAMVPDMATLFRMYSDQFAERTLRGSGGTRSHAKRRHIRIRTPHSTDI